MLAYNKRLNSLKEDKKASFNHVLPFQKPQSNQSVGTEASAVSNMAKTPASNGDPFAQLPEELKNTLGEFAKRSPGFSGGLEQYATEVQAIQKKYAGMNLPPELLQEEVGNILKSFVQSGQKETAFRNTMQQQQQLANRGVM